MKFVVRLLHIYAKMNARNEPKWFEPVSKGHRNLQIYNSITRENNKFSPIGDIVQWYSCGPTVYDISHMGHARAYISIDILRRVLQKYFKYNIHFVMNITDIDDKIIKRARQNHLFDFHVASKTPDIILMDIEKALQYSKEKLAKETDDAKKIMYETEIKKVEEFLKNKLNNNYDSIRDSLSDWLDKEYGKEVTDNAIFQDLPKKFEEEFHEDMRQLNVLPPDELTRVSEYIPQIIHYVEQIVEKGYGYESKGSVYFDVQKFDSDPKHYYAKLMPSAYGDTNLLQEGEGVLSDLTDSGKRSTNDFALWKASKPGEPAWSSPWGKGRPGWHIECSAMASDRCGSYLDIHTGGMDLKFPHHDNEIAQAEAFFDSQQWVNYFLHTGHLTIDGCKMSKSLKNFISIRDALKKNSSRQLRLFFLQHSWKDTLNYSHDSMTEAMSFEKSVLDFFFNVRHVIRIQEKFNVSSMESSDLDEKLEKTKISIDNALSDSINTAECLVAIKQLIADCNEHFWEGGSLKSSSKSLRSAAVFVYSILEIFGVADEGCNEFGLIRYSQTEIFEINKKLRAIIPNFINSVWSIGVNDRQQIESICDGFSKTIEGLNGVEYLMEQLADFRQELRSKAISNKKSGDKKWLDVLELCDRLRDEWLPEAGIRLQDTKEDKPAIGLMPTWTWASPSGIDKVTDKKKQKQPKEKQQRVVKEIVDPAKMFVGEKYSQFDEKGLPTHDGDGKPLSKSQLKRLKKEQDSMKEKFNK